MSRQGFTRSTTYEEPLASDKIRCYPNGGFGRIRDVCVIGRVGLQRRNFKGGSCLTYFKVDVVYLVVRISPGSESQVLCQAGGGMPAAVRPLTCGNLRTLISPTWPGPGRQRRAVGRHCLARQRSHRSQHGFLRSDHIGCSSRCQAAGGRRISCREPGASQ
jgi:hypothetical protein